jgi:hypothetical protein
MTHGGIHGHVVGLISVVVGLARPAVAADDANQLIDGVTSRATAIHSIQLTYTHRAYWLQGGQATNDAAFDAEITVDGTNWVVRYPNSENFRMLRGQGTVSFVETESAENKAIYRTLNVEAPQTLQELINENPYFAAPRLGGFWYAAQVGFIDQKRRQAIVRGERQVDGVVTIELEWPVEANDFDEALIMIPDGIARARRGWLRICVAPELGYALPRIEYVTEDGQVEHEVAASEFVDQGGGVFFPRRATVRSKDKNGERVSNFVVHQVAKLNEPLRPDTFSMKVPIGTRVSDSRPGVPQSTFDLQSQDQLDQLNKALADPDSSSSWNKRRLLLAVNSVCFLVCLSIYVIQRCFRRF